MADLFKEEAQILRPDFQITQGAPASLCDKGQKLLSFTGYKLSNM